MIVVVVVVSPDTSLSGCQLCVSAKASHLLGDQPSATIITTTTTTTRSHVSNKNLAVLTDVMTGHELHGRFLL